MTLLTDTQRKREGRQGINLTSENTVLANEKWTQKSCCENVSHKNSKTYRELFIWGVSTWMMIPINVQNIFYQILIQVFISFISRGNNSEFTVFSFARLRRCHGDWTSNISGRYKRYIWTQAAGNIGDNYTKENKSRVWPGSYEVACPLYCSLHKSKTTPRLTGYLQRGGNE